MITQSDVKASLEYNPDTGVFIRKKTSNYNLHLVGKPAGYADFRGYVLINIKGKQYPAHRLAFLYMTGDIPKVVDHVNQDPTDNRWENLRAATTSQNGKNSKPYKNNKSGLKGVHWCKTHNKWIAQIRNKGERIRVGYFDSKEDAYKTYVEKSRELFGEYSDV